MDGQSPLETLMELKANYYNCTLIFFRNEVVYSFERLLDTLLKKNNIINGFEGLVDTLPRKIYTDNLPTSVQ